MTGWQSESLMRPTQRAIIPVYLAAVLFGKASSCGLRNEYHLFQLRDSKSPRRTKAENLTASAAVVISQRRKATQLTRMKSRLSRRRTRNVRTDRGNYSRNFNDGRI